MIYISDLESNREAWYRHAAQTASHPPTLLSQRQDEHTPHQTQPPTELIRRNVSIAAAANLRRATARARRRRGSTVIVAPVKLQWTGRNKQDRARLAAAFVAAGAGAAVAALLGGRYLHPAAGTLLAAPFFVAQVHAGRGWAAAAAAAIAPRERWMALARAHGRVRA